MGRDGSMGREGVWHILEGYVKGWVVQGDMWVVEGIRGPCAIHVHKVTCMYRSFHYLFV